jgi:hypothetical protein
MKTLSQEQQTAIFEFLNGLKTEVCITDYVNIEDIDFENAFESIQEKIQDNNGFEIDIIYYSNAIKYLQENDPSLRKSLEIASDLGYTTENLNSELLASLLASQDAISEFYELETEINDYFSELLEELETEEEEEEEEN